MPTRNQPAAPAVLAAPVSSTMRNVIAVALAAILVSVIDGAIQAEVASQRGNGSTVVVDPSGSRDIMTEILRLRGEKARLFGYANYAQFATADRMAGTPETAMAPICSEPAMSGSAPCHG